MPAGKKRFVIDNLEEFAEKIITLVSVDSDEGRKQLVGIIEAANKRYQKPNESWLKSWLYQYTRTRGGSAQQAIKDIADSLDIIRCLQEFKALIGAGEWKKGSYNTYLILELSKKISGYESHGEELSHKNLVRLKELIDEQIDEVINQSKAHQKEVQIRDAERQSTLSNTQKTSDNVRIFLNLEQAKAAAITQPENSFYCLEFKSNKLKLSWIDFTGRAYAISPSTVLRQLVNSQMLESVDRVNSPQIKRECVKTQEDFLARIQVLVNPLDKIETLINKGTRTTFILLGNRSAYRLHWINSLSNVVEIPLESHPELKQWLNSLSAIDESHQAKLKTYLLQINTGSALKMENFQKVKACVEKNNRPLTARKESDTIKRINLQDFALLEQCLSGHLKQDLDSSDAESPTARPAPGKLDLQRHSIFSHHTENRSDSEDDDNSDAEDSENSSGQNQAEYT